MTILLNHPFVIKLMATKSKFEDNQQFDDFLATYHPGKPAVARDEAVFVVTEWLRTYTGSFPYVKNAKIDLENRGVIPHVKLRGLVNTLRSEAIAAKSGRTFTPGKFVPRNGGAAVQTHDTDVTLDIVVSSDYSLPTTGTSLETSTPIIVIHVDKPGPNSKWYGWIFISGGTDPTTFANTHKLSRTKIGSQRPGGTLKLSIAPTDPVAQIVMKWASNRAAGNGVQAAPAAPTSPAPAPMPKKVSKLTPLPPAPDIAPVAKPQPEPKPEPKPEQPANIRDLVKKRYGL